jgi:hypothetical protein
LRRTIHLIAGLLLIGVVGGAVTLRKADVELLHADPSPHVAPSPRADLPPNPQPTKKDCMAAVKQARSLAAALPATDLSRYFAERDLLQAMTEASIGEFDDCMEWAVRAKDEVQERRHALQPGEGLKILRADE